MPVMTEGQEQARLEQRKYKHGFDVDSSVTSDESDGMSSDGTNELKPNEWVGQDQLPLPLSQLREDANRTVMKSVNIQKPATPSTTVSGNDRRHELSHQDIASASEQLNNTIEESSSKRPHEDNGKASTHQIARDSKLITQQLESAKQGHKRAYKEFLVNPETQYSSYPQSAQFPLNKLPPGNKLVGNIQNPGKFTSFTQQTIQSTTIDMLANGQIWVDQNIPASITKARQMASTTELEKSQIREEEAQHFVPPKQDDAHMEAAEQRESQQQRELEIERIKNAELIEQIKLLSEQNDEIRQMSINARSTETLSTLDSAHLSSRPPSNLLDTNQNSTSTSKAYGFKNGHLNQTLQSPLPATSVKNTAHGSIIPHRHSEVSWQNNEDHPSKETSKTPKERSNAKILEEWRRREEKKKQLRASHAVQGDPIRSNTPEKLGQAQCCSSNIDNLNNHSALEQPSARGKLSVQRASEADEETSPQCGQKVTSNSLPNMSPWVSDLSTKSSGPSNITSFIPSGGWQTLDPPLSIHRSNFYTLPRYQHTQSHLTLPAFHSLSSLPFTSSINTSAPGTSKQTPVKKGLTDDQKLERKRRDDEKALHKKRQQLVEEARSKNITLDGRTLDDMLASYMDKRERDNIRRAASRQKKESHIPAETSQPVLLPSDERVFVSDVQQRKRRLSAAKGTRYHKMADRVKSVADLQAGFAPQFGAELESKSGKNDAGSSDEDDIDDTEDIERNREAEQIDWKENKPYIHFCQSTREDNVESDDESVEDEDDSFYTRTQPTTTPNTSFSTTVSPSGVPQVRCAETSPPPGQYHVYIVTETQISPGKYDAVSEFKRFASRDDANHQAQTRVLAYRSRYAASLPILVERYDENSLYAAHLWLDPQAKNRGVNVRVKRIIQGRDELLELVPSDVQPLLPVKIYLVRKTITTRKSSYVVNEYGDGGNEIVENTTSTILPDLAFADLQEANNAAFDELVKVVKPKTANIDWVKEYRAKTLPNIETQRAAVLGERNAMSLSLELSENEGMDWLREEGVAEIQLEVEIVNIIGPRN